MKRRKPLCRLKNLHGGFLSSVCLCGAFLFVAGVNMITRRNRCCNSRKRRFFTILRINHLWKLRNRPFFQWERIMLPVPDRLVHSAGVTDIDVCMTAPCVRVQLCLYGHFAATGAEVQPIAFCLKICKGVDFLLCGRGRFDLRGKFLIAHFPGLLHGCACGLQFLRRPISAHINTSCCGSLPDRQEQLL